MEDAACGVSACMGRMIVAAGIVALVGLVSFAGDAFGAVKTLANGDQVTYDGTYYDFRAANGLQMVKVWVPPAAEPVRGLFLSGHGGGSGDSRDFARDANMKAVAARWGFGLAGLHTFPGRRVYDQYGKVFFDALNEFAALGHHPELANVPFVAFGSSNGGSSTYGFVNCAPERAICFTTNVSTWFNPQEPTDGALAVPGVLIVGMFDPFSREDQGVQALSELLAGARARGARWAGIVEEKGHEDGVAFDVYLKLVEQCIALRYPADADPREGPVALREIPEGDGWLADMGSWDSGFTEVAPYASYTGDRAAAGWLANEDLAYIYRGGATHQNRLAVGVEEVDRVYNPNTDPGTMFSIGGPVVEPGRTLKLVCDVRDMPDWSRIEFFNGSRKLGEVSAPAAPVLSVEVPQSDIVWCLTAVGHTAGGDRAAAAPFYIAVRDPLLELVSEAEKSKPVYEDAIGPVGSKTALEVPEGYVPKADAVEKNVLVAYGLTAEQERTFGAAAGAVSAFWAAIDDEHDNINMLPRTHAREGSEFSIVTTADARLKVKAAHSARGLYLYFEVMDNQFMNASDDPAQYPNVDALDVLLDSKSSTALHDPSNVTQAINAGWDLYLTTKQYQIAFGRDEVPAVMRRIFADPWDVVFNRVVPMAEVEACHGMHVRHAKISSLSRVQEWFIPWSEFGRPGDIAAEPPVGTRLAFAPGYNDRDPGSETSKELRWVDNTSPWVFSATSEALPRGWGDIEIGPMVGAAR
jgi:hypothetical protein